MGTYQYKVVLVSPLAGCFRNKDLDDVIKKIRSSQNAFLSGGMQLRMRHNSPRSEEDFTYAFDLYKTLKKLDDYIVRIESPFISFYSNNKKHVDAIIKIEKNNVKYLCSPPEKTELEPGVIFLPKVPYDYKVTIGKTTQQHDAFLSWADSTNKVKITKSCRRMLERNSSWGGGYFYVKGDNMLLMTKMHLGSSVSKVDRIIHTIN